jgi:transposase InsO family protein
MARLADSQGTDHPLGNVLLEAVAQLNGKPVRVLFDCGSQYNAVNTRWCAASGEVPQQMGSVQQQCATMASGQQVTSPGRLFGRLRLGGYSEPMLLQAFPLGSSLGVVLGKPWLTAKGADIDFRNNTVTFRHHGRVLQLHCRLPGGQQGAGGVHHMGVAQGAQPGVAQQTAGDDQHGGSQQQSAAGRILLINSRAMRKELRRGAKGFMVQVAPVHDPEQLLAVLTAAEQQLESAGAQSAGSGGSVCHTHQPQHGSSGAAAGGGGSVCHTTHQPQPGGSGSAVGGGGSVCHTTHQPPPGGSGGGGVAGGGTCGSSGGGDGSSSSNGDHGAATPAAASGDEQLRQLAAAADVPGVQERLEALLLKHKQVFDRTLAQPAADYQPPVQCQIPLQEGAVPYRVTSPRALSPMMLQVLKEHLQQLIDAGYIRPSSSEWAAPIVFAEKADGTYRMCCDMRQLNSRSKRTAYPLPRISEILEQLQGARCFTTLDLVQGFHQVPMHPADIAKTAFSTRYGLFEWVVMPFGLSGAPGQFMQLMNSVLKEVLDSCCIVFMDDILVYSATPEQHLKDLDRVLSLLRRAGLACKPSKCRVGQRSVKFLGFIISGQGVAVDPAKVEAISQWPTPTEQRHVRQFLGMANFYRKFVRGFSSIAKPLNDLLKTGSGGHNSSSSKAAGKQPVVWEQQQQQAFDTLKAALCSPPVLANYDPALPCVVTTDASEYAVGGVLEQETTQGRRPVAYASRSMNPAEQNYGATDRENLALVYCVEEWQHMLEGSLHPVTCYTDHQALVSLLGQEQLSRRQARWIMALAQYNLRVQYIRGDCNVVGDPLSRRPDHEQHRAAAAVGAPEGWQLLQKFGLQQAYEDYVAAQQEAQQQVSQLQHKLATQRAAARSTPPPQQQQTHAQPPQPGVDLQPGASPHIIAAMVSSQRDEDFLAAVRSGYAADPKTAAVLQQLQSGGTVPPKRAGGQQWVLDDGLLWQQHGDQRRVYLPADVQLQTQVLQRFHDEPSAAHRGPLKTLARIHQHYAWAGMRAQVFRYCRSCPVCQAAKSSNQPPAGQPQPLAVPDRPWQHICMDFVGPLPSSAGYTSIMVVVDRFSKMAHFLPTVNTAAAPDTARLFISGVYRLHGLPESIVSDRDRQFVSSFWSSLMSQLGVRRSMSTANHPQSDGQTERVNRVLKEMLRAYVSPKQDNWVHLLPILEFAYNSSVHDSTGFAPFQVVRGYVPASAADRAAQQQQQQQQGAGASRSSPNHAAERLALTLQDVHREAAANIAQAQLKQAGQLGKRRSKVQFKAGDRVLLSTDLLRDLKAPGARSLHRKFFGPFSIKRMVGPNAAELELPLNWSRIHPVVNVGYLRLCSDTDEFGVRVAPPPEPVMVDGGEELEVESILDCRTRRYGRGSRMEYLVQWAGYPLWECTWEPKSNLTNCPDMIRDFHESQQRSEAMACLFEG